VEGTIGMSAAGRRARLQTPRAVNCASRVTAFAACLVTLGLALMLAATGTASAASKLEPIVTRVRLHHGHLLLRKLVARSERARAAIVGGTPIAISQAPWQVVVIAVLSETEGLLCGGSILSDDEILTAAHCVYNPTTRTQIPADQIVVGAGTADIRTVAPQEQASVASAVRVHPYYVYDPEATQPAPDDVAVLSLETPLLLDAAVKQIGVAPASSTLPEGMAVDLSGFGEEDPLTGELSGELNHIGMTLAFSRECGEEANALFLCASTPTASDCFGDSGSGLTLPSSPAALIGVTDTTEVIDGRPCVNGSVGGFANVTAPEIRDFVVDDDSAPPRAPRGGGAVLRGIPSVGDTLICEHGAWSNGPSFTYSFIDAAGGAVLQHGASSTYALTGADVGRTILCEVLAANAGGTGVGRTLALEAIRRTLAEEEATARKKQEEAAGAVRNREEELSLALTKRRQEEEAIATRKREEEAQAGVLSSKEQSPDAAIAGLSLRASPKGALTIRISCAHGDGVCKGTVTLRTLHAVVASSAGAGEAKAAILMLASGAFSIPGGEVKTVTLHLSEKARLVVGRSHVLRVRVTLVVHNPEGATHTSQAIATLRAGR
jgi:trypsin